MRKDLTGQRFGSLTAVKPGENTPKGGTTWECRCDCGRICVVTTKNLTSGHTQSCGCKKSRDRSGERFGRLVVLGRSDKREKRGKRTVPLWQCQCDCGAIVYRAMDALTTNQNCMCRDCMIQNQTKEMRAKAGFEDGTQLCKIRDMKLTKSNTSGVRGVYFVPKTQSWRADIKFKGKKYYIGTYKNLDDAAKARARAEEEIFGKYLTERAVYQNA